MSRATKPKTAEMQTANPDGVVLRDLVSTRLRAIRTDLESHGVVHLFLFGSVARGEATSESDVDVILDDREERGIDLFDLVAIRPLLEKQLEREVDIGTRRSLRSGKHDAILSDLYEVF